MEESRFNHLEICCFLYHGNVEKAITAFYRKTKGLSFTPLTRNAYLSSLNIGIYNYILIQENISLHFCCMENEKEIIKSTNSSLLEVGHSIICSYAFDRHYLVEKYQNPHIKKAITYIHEHLNEPLSLELVSEAVSINSSYLCQLFKQEVQMNFCCYILQQRMKLADKLLSCTASSIQEIAENCGFKNAAYFSTCYKRYTGRKPTHLRQSPSEKKDLTMN